MNSPLFLCSTSKVWGKSDIFGGKKKMEKAAEEISLSLLFILMLPVDEGWIWTV